MYEINFFFPVCVNIKIRSLQQNLPNLLAG